VRGWIIRIGIIAVIAIGAFVFRDRISGGARDLQVGDCFDRPASANTTVKDVQHHPCTEAHTAEAFFVGKNPAAPGAPPPSDNDWLAYLASACLPAYTSYTGADIMATTVMDVGAILPPDGDWKSGDRDVTCYAYRLDGGAMAASIKKSP